MIRRPNVDLWVNIRLGREYTACWDPERGQIGVYRNVNSPGQAAADNPFITLVRYGRPLGWTAADDLLRVNGWERTAVWKRAGSHCLYCPVTPVVGRPQRAV